MIGKKLRWKRKKKNPVVCSVEKSRCSGKRWKVCRNPATLFDSAATAVKSLETN